MRAILLTGLIATELGCPGKGIVAKTFPPTSSSTKEITEMLLSVLLVRRAMRVDGLAEMPEGTLPVSIQTSGSNVSAL